MTGCRQLLLASALLILATASTVGNPLKTVSQADGRSATNELELLVKQVEAHMPTISDLTEADVVERLGRDVTSTLGIEHVDVVRATARQHRQFTDDPGAYVERVVEDVQQYFHDTFVDTTWPACPRHPNHPMWFGADWWLADGQPLARLGELALLRTPKSDS